MYESVPQSGNFHTLLRVHQVGGVKLLLISILLQSVFSFSRRRPQGGPDISSLLRLNGGEGKPKNTLFVNEVWCWFELQAESSKS